MKYCLKCGCELDIIQIPIGTGSGLAMFGCRKCNRMWYDYIKVIPEDVIE